MDAVFHYIIKSPKYHLQLSHSLIALFFLLFEHLNAQKVLEFPKESYCLYHGDTLPEELYTYSIESDTFEIIKDEILDKTNSENNFELIWSNVPSVLAIIDNEKRYVLYSRRHLRSFLKQPEGKILAIAMLAHAIGHHVNHHRLISATHEEEEMEADEFMGYTLSLLGFSQEQVEHIPSKAKQFKGLQETDRLKAILRGYHKADASLLNAEHASYYENNANQVIQNFPKFNLPPPKWSTDADLDKYFEGCKTMYDAERIIISAMDATGYYSRKYYRTEGGFAMVTKLEQFNEDGSCKSETTRWKTKPVNESEFSITSYLYSLFVPEPGFFRVIIFVVTPKTFSADSKAIITREEATAWLNEGRNRLPEPIGKQVFTPGITNVSALIYEFLYQTGNNKLIFKESSDLQGLTHLKMSKFLDNLH